MKCPDCGSDLNTKETVILAGRSRIEATVCVFCGSLAALPADGAQARRLDACPSCGAPLTEAVDVSQPQCAPCGDAASRHGSRGESVEEAEEHSLKEALLLFPPVPDSRGLAYFGQVLGVLVKAVGRERAAHRLVIVSDLGFRMLSTPGGTIIAGAELLASLEDEAMLAFFLARELAHQESGRVFRRLRSRYPSGPLSSGFEWGISLITGGVATLGSRQTEALNEVVRLGYGKANEESADAIATGLLVRIGYDPGAAVRCLALIEARDLSTRRALAAFLDVRPARSRRRALVDLLVFPHTDLATPARLNRDVYRRAASRLARVGVFGGDARGGSRSAARRIG